MSIKVPYDSEEITRLDLLLALLQKTGTSEGVGSVHPISVRVPTVEFATIHALSKHSGLSVNKVVIQLLSVSLHEVWNGLTEENRKLVAELRAAELRRLLQSEEVSKLEFASKGEI